MSAERASASVGRVADDRPFPNSVMIVRCILAPPVRAVIVQCATVLTERQQWHIGHWGATDQAERVVNRPRSATQTPIWVREPTPSLSRICSTWDAAARGVILSR